MLKVMDTPIFSDEVEVLVTLRETLMTMGVDKLQKIKPNHNSVLVTCPYHKDGHERKPSCVIYKDTSSFYCFTCKQHGTLEQFVSACFGLSDGGLYGGKWLLSNFVNCETSKRKPIDFSLRSRNTRETYVPEEELQRYRCTHPYLKKRGISEDVINMFDVGFDPHFRLREIQIPCITFPVRDAQGRTLFIARRAVDQKMYHYPLGVQKHLYGLYELSRILTPEVYVCESIINALTIWSYGKFAVALNGTGVEHQYRELERLPQRRLVLALDGDEAGRLGTKKIIENVKGILMAKIHIPEGKDVNDLSREEFLGLEEELIL